MRTYTKLLVLAATTLLLVSQAHAEGPFRLKPGAHGVQGEVGPPLCPHPGKIGELLRLSQPSRFRLRETDGRGAEQDL